jgi:hypothetical protein
VWFFAFRDKPHEAVFKEMTAALDHLGEVSITYKYNDTEGEVEASVPGYDAIIKKYESVSIAKDADDERIVKLRTNIMDLYNYIRK